MVRDDVAGAVLAALGGKGNVLTNTVCMTRLRVTLVSAQAVDFERLNDIPSVLGTATRGVNGLEVVFGPRVIDGIYHAFIRLTGIQPSMAALFPMSRQNKNISVQINARHTGAESDGTDDELDLFDRLLESDPTAPAKRVTQKALRRLLVINGPNVNMLGVGASEADASYDYAALLEACKQTAAEAGFAQCVCYQSNHLGDLVDQIQDAFCIFDAIIMNPAGYACSRVLTDALTVVELPYEIVTLEEGIPEGFEAYRKAIFDLAHRLDEESGQAR